MSMLKLMKYEYKKNRGILLGLGLIVLGLEMYFLGSYALNEMDHMGIAAGFLVVATIVSFFMVFILGVNNYQKELNSKSSYLIFMTPNSSIKIVLSKLLYLLILGIVVCLVMGGLALLDIQLTAVKFNERYMLIDALRQFARGFGIDLSLFWTSVLLQIVYVVVSFFTVVAIAYFAITLSTTILQNNRFRGFISVVLFILLMIGVNYIDNHFIQSDVILDTLTWDVIRYIMPTLVYNVIVMAACVFGCSFLIDKAVSL